MTDIQFNMMMSALRRLQLDVTAIKRRLAELELMDKKASLSSAEIAQRVNELEDLFSQIEDKHANAA